MLRRILCLAISAFLGFVSFSRCTDTKAVIIEGENMLRQTATRALRRHSQQLYNCHARQIHYVLDRASGARQLPLRKPRPPLAQQQSRTLFNSYRRRVQQERQSGNWASLRVPIVAAIVTITLGLLLIIYGYTTYQEWAARAFHNYPPSVAKELRRAIYYSQKPGSSSYNPQDAIRHLIAALEKAKLEGMHPLSREVTGIKIEIARVCEECGRRDKAVEVLKEVWSSFRKGLEVWDTRITGNGETSGTKEANPVLVSEAISGGEVPQVVTLERRRADLEMERTGLVRRLVETGVKLGSLLLQDWTSVKPQAGVLEEDNRKRDGRKVLELTIETIIAEEQRRNAKLKDRATNSGNTGDRHNGWLTPVELASAFEILATHYLATESPQLATPLLIHAIHTLYPAGSVGPPDDATRLCHAATLMNTVAVAMSEVGIARGKAEVDSSSQEASSQTAAAERWAKMARDLCTPRENMPTGLKEVLGTEECVQARITAVMNLAELSLQYGDPKSAKEGFGVALKESKAIGWQEGVDRAKEGIENVLRG